MTEKNIQPLIRFDDLSPAELAAFNTILNNLLQLRGIDFRQYRPKSLRRRVTVGMRDVNLESFADYLNFLRKNPQEYDNLLDRITVNVSEFFRNPETFSAVKKILIPELAQRKMKTNNRIIRIWSAGCATGEEPYSLAILFKEFLESSRLDLKVNIYATDIDTGSLEKAQKGCYSLKALKELSNFQRGKYFEKTSEDVYVVKPELKEPVKFMRHNMISDEPLMRIDMLFCRNVFIYFSQELQSQVYEKFAKALVAGGYFVAGKTEMMLDAGADFFERVDMSERIYRKK